MSELIRAVWSYRGFIRSSIANEFRARLTRSRLGTAWIVLQPLAQVLIFTLVLSEVLSAKLQGIDDKHAYAVYLMSGMLCWSLFTDIVQRCTTVFIDNAPLLKKMRFPRSCLPLIAIGSALVANVALLVVMLCIVPWLGFGISTELLWLPLLVLLTAALAAGLGLVLGILNVFVRDVGQVVAVLLQLWFWVTPIVYPIAIVPRAVRATLAINPVVPIVEGFQSVFVYSRAPPASLWYTAAVAVVALGLGLVMFKRASADLVDVL